MPRVDKSAFTRYAVFTLAVSNQEGLREITTLKILLNACIELEPSETSLIL